MIHGDEERVMFGSPAAPQGAHPRANLKRDAPAKPAEPSIPRTGGTDKNIGEELQKMFANKFKRADKAFMAINEDHKGGISRDEMRKYLEGFGASAELSNMFYDKMDKDGDGSVGLEEFNRIVAPIIHGEEEQNQF